MMSRKADQKKPSASLAVYNPGFKREAKASRGESSLDAAALQADFAKRFNLPGAQRTSNSGAKKTSSSIVSGRKSMSQSSFCSSCSTGVISRNGSCMNCGFIEKSVRATSVTISQQRGLVPMPPSVHILTPAEWDAIEMQLDERMEAYCPICMEGFKQGSEVLLSCSHMFHKNCIQSFEKFSASSNKDRHCPVCRSSDYQKKITRKGSLAFKNVCIVRLQSFYRGYVVRKIYYKTLKHFYQSGMGEKHLRKQFYERELVVFGDDVTKTVDNRGVELDAFLRSTDSLLDENRSLDALFEQMLSERLSSSHAEDANQQEIINIIQENTVATNAGSRERSNDTDFMSSSEQQQPVVGGTQSSDSVPKLTDGEWREVYGKAVQREEVECAICMGDITFIAAPLASGAPMNPGQCAAARRHRTVLLSCSHVYHDKCIHSFEKFSPNEGQKMCPVCRDAGYEKRMLAWCCPGFSHPTNTPCNNY